jgi:hypothetical protein
VVPSLFEEEFEDALLRLQSKRNAGLPHPTPKRSNLRRLLLPKTEYHLYFALERDETVLGPCSETADPPFGVPHAGCT